MAMLFQRKEESVKGNIKRDVKNAASLASAIDSVSGIDPSNLSFPEERDATELFWEDGIVPVSNLNADQPSGMEHGLTVEFNDLPFSSQRKSIQRASAKEKVVDLY